MTILNTGIFRNHNYNKYDINTKDSIHLLNRVLNINENDNLIPTNPCDDDIINIKLYNWYMVSYSKLENFIVCKAKDYETEESIYILFDIFHYYLCDIEFLESNILLSNLKKEIDQYKHINKMCLSNYIKFDSYKIISNEVQIQYYYNFKDN